jgi:hypothetical protein
MHEQASSLTRYALPALFIVVLLVLRLRRMNRGTRLRLETLWIVPLAYAVLTVGLLWSTPPAGPVQWLIVAAGFAAGALAGWQRGRSIRLTIDPETHQLNQRASPLTFLLLAGLIALRAAMRQLALSEGEAWHLNAALITDALVAMALGLFALSRLELYLRGKRMLAELRAGM